MAVLGNEKLTVYARILQLINVLIAVDTCIRADSRFLPSRWVSALLCNEVSHWLAINLESFLHACRYENWVFSQSRFYWRSRSCNSINRIVLTFVLIEVVSIMVADGMKPNRFQATSSHHIESMTSLSQISLCLQSWNKLELKAVGLIMMQNKNDLILSHLIFVFRFVSSQPSCYMDYKVTNDKQKSSISQY